MRVLLAEDDRSVGDAYQAVFEARHHMVFRSSSVGETIAWLTDGRADVAVLDVQLADGTAWDVLDRMQAPTTQFRVALVSAVDVTPPQRWAHLPMFRKPLDHQELLNALDEAAHFRPLEMGDVARTESPPKWIERLLLAEPPSWPIGLLLGAVAITLVTLAAIPLREEAPAAIGAAYTIAVLAIAAMAGMRAGVLYAVAAFLAYNYFAFPPYHTLAVESSSLFLSLLAFLAAALAGAILIGTGRVVARRQASDAAISRFRLSLRSQTQGISSGELVAVTTRVVKEAVSPSTEVEIILPGQSIPNWVFPESVQRARTESRTVEELGRGLHVLLLPANKEGTMLAVGTPGTHISDQDRRLLGVAVMELGRVAEQLKLHQVSETAERLSARDEAKNAVLAAVSHDLRTPLAAMKVAVTTALETELALTERQRQGLLETVRDEVDRLGRMIDHLLDLSRLESGAFRLNHDMIDLAHLAKQAADQVELSSGREIQVFSSGGTALEGDAIRLLEVLTNLMENAARYSTPGTVILAEIEPAETSVTVTVSDEGPGMDSEEQERLFLPFHRSSRTGTGLGLAISRSIVMAHGGSIEVASRPGVGTTISVVLPRRSPAVPLEDELDRQ